MENIVKMNVLSVLFAVLIGVTSGAQKLKCYECSSLTEPGCGETLTLTQSESDQYLRMCEGDQVACTKIVNKDNNKQHTLVTRSCWNSSLSDLLDNEFFSCSDIMKLGQSCYCNTNQCNGASDLPCSTIVTFTLLGAAILFVKKLRF